MTQSLHNKPYEMYNNDEFTLPTELTIPVTDYITYNNDDSSSNDDDIEIINNKLRVVSKLGQGSYGIVELVECINNKHHKTAIKRLSKSSLRRIREYIQDSNTHRSKCTTGLDKLKYELLLYDKYLNNHQYIVKLQHIYIDNNNHNDEIILEYDYASDNSIMYWNDTKQCYIYRKTNKSYIDEQDIKLFTIQLLDVLSYLYDNYIVHRDLKPDNILLTNNYYTIQLCDFGVAKQFNTHNNNNNSNNNTVLTHDSCNLYETHGTYYYFSPEMCSGDEFNAFTTEIYQLGLCLYIFAYNGRLPFYNVDNNNDISPQAIFDDIQHKTIEIPVCNDHIVSNELTNIILNLLQKEPNKRYTIKQLRELPYFNSHINNVDTNDVNNITTQIASVKLDNNNNTQQKQANVHVNNNNRDNSLNSVKVTRSEQHNHGNVLHNNEQHSSHNTDGSNSKCCSIQ